MRSLPGAGQAANNDLPAVGAVRQAATLWWLNPTRIMLMGILPIYLGVLAYEFKRVVPNTYVPSHLYFFGLLLIVALAVGAQWALTHVRPQAAMPPARISLTAMLLLLVPTLLAYAVWFWPLMSQPQLLLEIVSGRRAELRDDISTVKGVTTFTQFGVAYVIAYALKSGSAIQKLTRIEHAGFVVVFLLAMLRAFAWAERLAVIELLVCFSITRMAYLSIHSLRRWQMASVLPAVAIVGLYLIFTTGEYFRSWDYYVHEYDSVWAFTLDRLINYYATAVNNGIGVLVDTDDWPYYNGAFVFESLYLTPGLGTLLRSAFGDPRGVEQMWIETYGRPEFNSPTAYFRTLLDLGYLGSVVLYLGLGYLVGRAYVGFKRGQAFGLLMYGVLVLFMMESLRYAYLSEPRFVPLALGLVLLAMDMRRQRLQHAGAWLVASRQAPRRVADDPGQARGY